MPCDTPPPPPELDEDAHFIVEDDEEFMYEIIDDNMEETPDSSILTFSGHKGAVFCCNFNNTAELAVSGGQDDTAYVWNTNDGSVKFECAGHSESVIAACFSPDSSYVATADMDGNVQVWDVNKGSKIWSFETSEISWMYWLHKSNVLIAGTVDGNSWKWIIPDDVTNVFQYHGTGSSSGCIFNNDETIAIGYDDGCLRLLNINNLSVTGVLSGQNAHRQSINVIACNPDNTLILTGSEDGTAKLMKTSNCQVLWTINCCDGAPEHSEPSVEGVGFCSNQSLVATGTNCGCFCIWDVSTKRKRHNIHINTSVVRLICDATLPAVYTGLADGVIECYDIRSGTIEKKYFGHQVAILDLSISLDNTKMLSSSDDYTCKIFDR